MAMTLAAALARLITARFDRQALDPAERADILNALPVECRWESESHGIACTGTLLETLDYLLRHDHD